MKRMNLQALGLSVNDLLSREQMKRVMGGDDGSGGGSGDAGCPTKTLVCNGQQVTVQCKWSNTYNKCMCSTAC